MAAELRPEHRRRMGDVGGGARLYMKRSLLVELGCHDVDEEAHMAADLAAHWFRSGRIRKRGRD